MDLLLACYTTRIITIYFFCKITSSMRHKMTLVVEFKHPRKDLSSAPGMHERHLRIRRGGVCGGDNDEWGKVTTAVSTGRHWTALMDDETLSRTHHENIGTPSMTADS